MTGPRLFTGFAGLLGGCPVCRQVTGLRRIGDAHWGYCLPHRHAWPASVSLADETGPQPDAEMCESIRFLNGFAVVPETAEASDEKEPS